MNFHNIRLPKFIEIFATASPVFINSNILTKSGREVRSLDREYASQRYLVKNCRLSSLEFEQFNSFFRGRRGSNYAFRFKDSMDCQVNNQFIAKGDGKLKNFNYLNYMMIHSCLIFVLLINQ